MTVPRMNELQNYVLTQLTFLIEQHLINVIPNEVLYKIVWDAAQMNGITMKSCHYELHRCIVTRLKNEIYFDSLIPFLTLRNVKIPDYWVFPSDLFEVLEPHVDIYTVKGVTTIYKSLDDLGPESPYFKIVLAFLESSPKSEKGESEE
nr:hypothetical protein [Apium graveolens]